MYVTAFAKPSLIAQEFKSNFKELATLFLHSGTPSISLKMAKCVFTAGFLLILLKHEGTLKACGHRG